MIDTRSYDCGCDEFHRGGVTKAGEPVHDMWLRFTIDLDFMIRDVQAAADQTPFPICPRAAGTMSELIGLRIGSGWIKQVRERIGTDRSCTHLMDLFGPLASSHCKISAFAGMTCLTKCHSVLSPNSEL